MDDTYKRADGEQYDGGEEQKLFCCQGAMIDVSEKTALCLFILTFLGWGPLIGSCIDKKGCNWSLFFFGFVPVLPICLMY